MRRGEGGHPDGLAISGMLEQQIEIAIVDCAKDKMPRPLPHERRR
jgi:hypothetical protein